MLSAQKKIIPVLIALSFVISQFSFLTSLVYAQTDISGVYDITDKSAKDGDIMVFLSDKGITRATSDYDSHIFGVLQSNPTVVYRRVDNTGSPIVRSGVTDVNVTTLNGAIKTGDYITSSTIPGSGMKASQSGFVVGIALGNFDDHSGQPLNYQGKNLHSGSISVTLGIAYANTNGLGSGPFEQSSGGLSGAFNSLGNLSQGVGAAFLQFIQTPEGFNRLLKFVFAVLIMLVSLVFAFITLIRAIPKAIEAVGRNPLAKKSINYSLALNVALVAAVLAVAGFITVLILNL